MSAFKTFRPYEPFQELLLPPNLQDWVPDGHLARFVSELVDQLDLSPIFAEYEKGDRRGYPPYHPAMMMKLLVYGYCTGVRSSRGIERATFEVVPFRMLAADQHPDHDSISEFRRRHFDSFKSLFAQTVRVAQEAGLVDLAHVAVDGTKVKANASKHKAMSYDRMQQAEKELQADIDRILAEAEAIDQAEDKKFGKGRRGDELPKELQRREDRVKKIRDAMKRLEEKAWAEAAEQAEKAKQKIAERREREAQTGEKPAGRDPKVPNLEKARPEPKAQSNFTDPDSRIMKDGATKEFTQAYNAQNAVDSKRGVIVGTHVTQAANDVDQLAPTVAEAETNCGRKPEKVSADTGYCSDAALNDARLEGIDLYIATGRERKSAEAEARNTAATVSRIASLMVTLWVCCAGVAASAVAIVLNLLPEPLPASESTLQMRKRQQASRRLVTVALALVAGIAMSIVLPCAASAAPLPSLTLHTARTLMRYKLQTDSGKETYARRKAIVEAPFGSLKEIQGMRRFLVRGLNKVRGEWNLATACHNILKMFRHGKAAALAALGNGPGPVAVTG